jgi:hypothetical protein
MWGDDALRSGYGDFLRTVTTAIFWQGKVGFPFSKRPESGSKVNHWMIVPFAQSGRGD